MPATTDHADAIVVGAGFAGLAAATLLAERGARVVVLEARPYTGGRARSFVDPDTGSVVDNGQHLFLGAYRDTLALLARIGTADRLALQPRLRVHFLEPGGAVSEFGLPSRPLFGWSVLAGLWRTPGLSRAERWGLLAVAREVRRHSRAAAAADANGLDDVTVAAWLHDLGQGERARARLWDPIATAALNEDPDKASAAAFVPVLREMFLGGAASARLGVPRAGLSDLYADPAVAWLKTHDGEIRLRARVRRLVLAHDRAAGVVLEDGTTISAPHVILAIPPDDLLATLPPGLEAHPYFAACVFMKTSPIVSVYLWLSEPVTDLPFAGFVGGEWQWLFNRAAFGGRAGAGHGVTLVRSAAREFVDESRDALVRRALADLHRFLPRSRRAVLRHSLVIKERKACLSPVPGTAVLRPPTRTPFEGLHVAGDWTATGLPATVEGAALSGHACARQVLEAAGAGAA